VPRFAQTESTWKAGTLDRGFSLETTECWVHHKPNFKVDCAVLGPFVCNKWIRTIFYFFIFLGGTFEQWKVSKRQTKVCVCCLVSCFQCSPELDPSNLHNKSIGVVLANLRWCVCKNWTENRTSLDEVMVIGTAWWLGYLWICKFSQLCLLLSVE
jgi:hypothetical protein